MNQDDFSNAGNSASFSITFLFSYTPSLLLFTIPGMAIGVVRFWVTLIPHFSRCTEERIKVVGDRCIVIEAAAFMTHLLTTEIHDEAGDV